MVARAAESFRLLSASPVLEAYPTTRKKESTPATPPMALLIMVSRLKVICEEPVSNVWRWMTLAPSVASTDQPMIDPQSEVAAFCDSTDKWLPLVCTMNATLVTEAVRKQYGWDHEQMEREASSVPVGSGGLLMLPYLQGERTPSLPDGCGVLHGMTTENFTPAHVMRAAIEGVSLSLGYGLMRLTELGLEPKQVRVTGGGAKSELWRQMIADVTGLPVVALKTQEGAALGAALQATVSFFRHSGEDLTFDELIAYAVQPDESTICQPDPGNHEVYQKLLAQQQYLVDTLHTPGFL